MLVGYPRSLLNTPSLVKQLATTGRATLPELHLTVVQPAAKPNLNGIM